MAAVPLQSEMDAICFKKVWDANQTSGATTATMSYYDELSHTFVKEHGMHTCHIFQFGRSKEGARYRYPGRAGEVGGPWGSCCSHHGVNTLKLEEDLCPRDC